MPTLVANITKITRLRNTVNGGSRYRIVTDRGTFRTYPDANRISAMTGNERGLYLLDLRESRGTSYVQAIEIAGDPQVGDQVEYMGAAGTLETVRDDGFARFTWIDNNGREQRSAWHPLSRFRLLERAAR